MDSITKICTKCKKEKELISFPKDKQKSCGYRRECKNCCKQYKEKNKDVLKTKQKIYISNNKEKIKQLKINYRNRNKEQVRLQKQKSYQKNKQKILKRKNEYTNQRKKTNPIFKLKCSIRTRIGNSFKQANKKNFTKNSKTIEILGCDFQYFIDYISSKFTTGMSLENYGKWHLDHIIPLATAKTELDIIRLNHHTNFQPLWAKDNLMKHSKLNYKLDPIIYSKSA